MSIDYAEYEHLVATTQLFMGMFGMGALLTPADIVSQFRHPKSLYVALALQWLGLPLLAILSGILLPIPTGIAVGFLLVAIVPSGATGNVLTYLGRGNIALSIALTAITTLLALLMVPLLIRFFMAAYLPADYQLPFSELLRDIVFFLLLPLGAGMLLKDRLSAQHSEWLGKNGVRASLVLILVMAVGAASTGRLNPKAYGLAGIMALVFFCLLIQLTAFAACLLMKLPAADRLAIIIKSNYRNISLAVAIKAVIFPAHTGVIDPVGDAVFFTILLYGGVSLFASLTQVGLHRFIHGMGHSWKP